jgi:putative redox protein
MKSMIKVSGHITTEQYKTVLTNGRQELTGDEPKSSGGSDLGFSPGELLCSALATCTCVTLRMYADRKQWDLEGVEVSVAMEKDALQNVTHIKRVIQLSGNLTHEQKERLFEIAEQCPIHKTLTNPIQIKTALI